MTLRVKRKVIYLLFLLVVFVGFMAVLPTFAKFNDEYVTEEDVVGFQFNFDLKIDNLEEYEEVIVPSNSYEVFDVNIFNSTGNTLYYGVWYQVVVGEEVLDDVIVARLDSNLTEVTGELEAYKDKTVGVIIKNNSSNDITVNVGVNSSDVGISSIEYLGGKRLVTGSASEYDYYYDGNGKKYVSSIDSNQYFTLDSVGFQYGVEESAFNANHLGNYKVEVWSASKGTKLGSYVSGIIYLDKNEKLFFDLGKENDEDVSTSVHFNLLSDNYQQLDNRIMIIGDESYISGRYGDIALHFNDEGLQKKCVTGKEDVLCSRHVSGKYFTNINYIDSEHEMNSFDGKTTMIGNKGNGFAKVTPIVPSLRIPELSVIIGEELDLSGVECVDGGNGCHIVKVLPSNTSDLTIGHYNISFMVSDDNGVVYRYNSFFDVVS